MLETPEYPHLREPGYESVYDPAGNEVAWRARRSLVNRGHVFATRCFGERCRFSSGAFPVVRSHMCRDWVSCADGLWTNAAHSSGSGVVSTFLVDRVLESNGSMLCT